MPDYCLRPGRTSPSGSSFAPLIRGPSQEFKATQNCVACCNKDGLLKFLEGQQSALEVCEKALADYMESKRRAFPRFYFVSTADLLDILSNGNSPHKVCVQHRPRVGGGGGGGGSGAWRRARQPTHACAGRTQPHGCPRRAPEAA